jgi:outer membrane immunogenic protein
LRVSVALIALLGGSAYAADLPAGPAPVKAAPSFIPVGYNWTGFYFGANGGGNWTNTKDTITDVPTNAAIFTGSTNGSGFLAGGQIGFNYQFSPNWVAGLEADADWANNKNAVLSADASNRHDGKLQAMGTGRARLGYAVNNWLIYGTGGFAWSVGQVTRTQLFNTVNAATPITAETTNNTRFGWSVGGGVEWGFAPNWSVRAEYLFLGLQKTNYTFPLAGRTTASTLNISEARAALNYKFDWGGPVTARY